ncbi:MAG: 5-aminolevulinate synthase [Saprospiraceae bacterium]|nr:5-aminolevulinate synthase [Saprospiraceae bacterium]
MIQLNVMSLNYNALLNQKLDGLKQQGNYRYFLPLNKTAAAQPVFKRNTEGGIEQEIVNWTSNDYMGMSADADVIRAFAETAKTDGVGSGGTRNISGTTARHILLEKTVAELHGKEAAHIFNSAYLANSATLSVLGRAFSDTLIFSDAENHASMIEGIKLSRCEKKVFRHNDLDHLESLLVLEDIDRPKIIAFESVYSMSGTIAPITEIVKLAKKYNALTYLDEVHAVGLYGKHGEGVAGQMGCSDGIDIINGTFAKAYGCIGGYVTANAVLCDYIRSFGEGFIFTTSLPPAVCAAATASILKVKNNPQMRAHFHENVKILRGAFRDLNVPFEENPSHITRIIFGDAKRSRHVADTLLNEYGIYLQPINFPTVPRGQEGLRIAVSARHTTPQIELLAKVLRAVLEAVK